MWRIELSWCCEARKGPEVRRSWTWMLLVFVPEGHAFCLMLPQIYGLPPLLLSFTVCMFVNTKGWGTVSSRVFWQFAQTRSKLGSTRSPCTPHCPWVPILDSSLTLKEENRMEQREIETEDKTGRGGGFGWYDTTRGFRILSGYVQVQMRLCGSFFFLKTHDHVSHTIFILFFSMQRLFVRPSSRFLQTPRDHHRALRLHFGKISPTHARKGIVST